MDDDSFASVVDGARPPMCTPGTASPSEALRREVYVPAKGHTSEVTMSSAKLSLEEHDNDAFTRD